LNANPLLQAWKTPHGLPPFDLFRPEHFEPALRHAMDVHRGEVAAISGQTAAPDFDNTWPPSTAAGRLLGRVAMAFYNLTSSATSPELQAVQREVAGRWPRTTARLPRRRAVRPHRCAARAAHCWASTPSSAPAGALHLDFVRAGARLPAAARARYAQMMEELAA
jgi:peptidyl-dipeptidase Dcp